LEKGVLITGHENGFVVKWKIEDSSHQILFKSDSAVTTISFSGNEKIAVGYYSGGLYVIHLEGKDDVVTLRQPKYAVSERIWRTLWPDEENLMIASTYGELTTSHPKPNGY